VAARVNARGRQLPGYRGGPCRNCTGFPILPTWWGTSLQFVRPHTVHARLAGWRYRPPAEYEAIYYDQHNATVAPAGAQ
jgi:hypothetical protein